MHVLALRIELHFPSSHSLKEKRHVMKPIIEGVRSRFDVSIAEVDHQDTWQRTELGVALVGSQVSVLDDVADKIERLVWGATDTDILSIERRWLEPDW